MCVCNCRASQLIWHSERTVAKATREEQRHPVSKVTKEPRLSHTCAFQVITQGSKCAEYNRAEERTIKTQLRTKKSTSQGATTLLLDKKEPNWRVLFTMPCYQSLNSEQTVCLRGHRRTGCSLYSRRFPPTAYPFIRKTKKTFRVNTPNPIAYTVTTVPSSPLECPCLLW